MTGLRTIAAAAVVFQIWFTPIAGAGESTACFYLDKKKVQGDIMPVGFTKAGSATPRTAPIRLGKSGLFQGDEHLCRWSLNGGSGTKERFALDGGFAVPILDPTCEAPFGHVYTGVGFGDWYLVLCGALARGNLYVTYAEGRYQVPLDALAQWTRFAPKEFPIKGDAGE